MTNNIYSSKIFYSCQTKKLSKLKMSPKNKRLKRRNRQESFSYLKARIAL